MNRSREKTLLAALGALAIASLAIWGAVIVGVVKAVI